MSRPLDGSEKLLVARVEFNWNLITDFDSGKTVGSDEAMFQVHGYVRGKAV